MDFRSFHRLICRVSQLKRGGWSFVQNPSWWDIQKNSQNTSMVWNWCINNISNFEIPFRHIFSSKINVQMPKKSGKNPASRLASLIWCRKNRRDAASWSITSPPDSTFFIGLGASTQKMSDVFWRFNWWLVSLHPDWEKPFSLIMVQWTFWITKWKETNLEDTIPETNTEFTPENGWLEENHFLLGP